MTPAGTLGCVWGSPSNVASWPAVSPYACLYLSLSDSDLFHLLSFHRAVYKVYKQSICCEALCSVVLYIGVQSGEGWFEDTCSFFLFTSLPLVHLKCIYQEVPHAALTWRCCTADTIKLNQILLCCILLGQQAAAAAAAAAHSKLSESERNIGGKTTWHESWCKVLPDTGLHWRACPLCPH